MKCELLESGDVTDEVVLFKGTIDCEPEECQVILHKGRVFVYNCIDDDELATYVTTAVAEFTEAKD